MPSPAIVMNLFYTGLGIARSLGEHGIPVIGLTSHRRSYGNLTRFAKVRHCPDSRDNPEELLPFLLRLGQTLPGRAVIFPTRDDDLIFLDRYRDRLARYFIPVSPGAAALRASLDKWETFRCAQAAEVPVPRCWMVDGREDAARVAAEAAFPAVLKPVSAHQWRKTGNWRIVGERKAVAVASPAELLAEYEVIAQAESRVLVQEMVEGGDDRLWVAACYLDRQSNLLAGFTARKLLQVPAGFGTGCIVESADCPQAMELAARLLRSIGFSGIAEVEFKWDEPSRQYKLIEINPRPWDQHRLGSICGVDLIHTAYADLTGSAPPAASQPRPGRKWIAEDVYALLLLRSLWRRDGRFRAVRQLARGPRTYAIWSRTDPLPWVGFVLLRFLPDLVVGAWRYLRTLGRRIAGHGLSQKKVVSYEH